MEGIKVKKSYLLVYSGDMGDRNTVKNMLNELYMVEKWRYDLPNCFYIVSEYSAKQISEQLRAKSFNNGKFIISEIPSNSYGWLTDASWYLIQNHQYKVDEP